MSITSAAESSMEGGVKQGNIGLCETDARLRTRVECMA